MRWWCCLAAVLMLAATASAQPSPEPPSLAHARASYDAGKLDDARRELEALLKSGTTDPQAFLLLGVVERTAGDLPRAIATLRKGRALAPESEQMSMELATTLAWNRDLDEAIALFRQVLVRTPGNVGARIGLAFALAWQGRHTDGRDIFAALVDEDPKNVSGWLGLGFVARASLRRADAAAAYQRVLEIDPSNAEALAALEELRWDRRAELRALGGLSTDPLLAEDGGEARIDARFAASPRVTVNAGYQHYAFGDVSAITGGGFVSSTREEDSFEGGAVYRPSERTSIGATLYTFFSDEVNRGMVWAEGVLGVTSRISLVASVRPAFSDTEPAWLWAGAAGAAVSLPGKQVFTAKALVASNTTYEPRLTWLANYDLAPSRRFVARAGLAYSDTDEQFAFTSLSAGGTYLVTPSFGVSVDGSHRTGTAERSTVLVGVILRR